MVFCSDAVPNVRSPTTSPRLFPLIAAARTSAAPDVLDEISTSTGERHRTLSGDAVGHNMLRPNHRAIDTYFLRFRLAAPHHCHFHRGARRALQEHCRLTYR